jgi:anti-sigma regulatory factor (Ser/Thr protein kinase)
MADGRFPTVDTIVLDAPSAVPEVRHRTGEVLAGWRCRAESIDDAVLVASEVVTNAVEHGAGQVRVRLLRRGRRIRIEVQDDSPRPPVLLALGRTAERGRGLHIIAELAERWGSRRTAAGKIVWAELPSGVDFAVDDLAGDRISSRG